MNVQKLIGFAKNAKEQLAQEALGPEDAALAPVVAFGREGKTIACAFCRRVVRDDALEVAHIGIRGYGADETILVFDVHVRTPTQEEIEQHEFKELQRGAMQHDCEEHDGQHQDCNVKDALSFARATRDGVFELHTLPYEQDFELGGIEWLAPMQVLTVEAGSEDRAQGVIPEALRYTFQQPSFDAVLAKVEVEIDNETLSMSDVISKAVIQVMSEKNHPEVTSREFLDEMIGKAIEDRVQCKVVLSRGQKEAL